MHLGLYRALEIESWVPYCLALNTGKFSDGCHDNLELARLGDNRIYYFNKQFHTTCIQLSFLYRLQRRSLHHTKRFPVINQWITKKYGSLTNSTLRLMLFVDKFRTYPAADDIHDNRLEQCVYEILSEYNFPLRLSIHVIDGLTELYGNIPLAEKIGRILWQRFSETRGETMETHLVGLCSYAFGHQSLLSDFISKRIFLGHSIHAELVGHPAPASRALDKLNQSVIRASKEDYKQVKMRGGFSYMENGGFNEGVYYSSLYYLSTLNYQLHSRGIYRSCFEQLGDDIFLEAMPLNILNRLKQRKLVLVYFRTPRFKGGVPHRDSNEESWVRLVKNIIDSGFSVCRIGDKSEIFEDLVSDFYYDYPNDPTRTSGFDVALYFKSDLCVCGPGGAALFGSVLNKPTLLLDWPRFFNHFFHGRARLAYREHYQHGRQLNVSEYFQIGVNGSHNPFYLEEIGISSQPSSAASLIRDFHAFIDELSDITSFQDRSIRDGKRAEGFGHTVPTAAQV